MLCCCFTVNQGGRYINTFFFLIFNLILSLSLSLFMQIKSRPNILNIFLFLRIFTSMENTNEQIGFFLRSLFFFIFYCCYWHLDARVVMSIETIETVNNVVHFLIPGNANVMIMFFFYPWFFFKSFLDILF